MSFHETRIDVQEQRKIGPLEQMQIQHPQPQDPIGLHMVQEIVMQSYRFVLRLWSENG